MLKFNFRTNEHEGFKLNTQAEGEEEIRVLAELTKALIAKVDRIKVTIGYDDGK